MVNPTPNTATVPLQVETQHQDMIHDAQMDFYGKRLATCSSDRTIKIFDVLDPTAVEPKYTLLDTLRGHDGPVWQVSWAHPKFGSILASCSYDGKIFVWRENVGNNNRTSSWEKIKEHTLHSASVNSIAWAPHEYGPILACASSDGKVSVLTFKDDGTWDAPLFTAHLIGCNAVSWQPYNPTSKEKILATGGSDSEVKLWKLNQLSQTWELLEKLELSHNDCIRDVAFSPCLIKTYLATASHDKLVNVWSKDSNGWSKQSLDLTTFVGPIWSLSWSLSGNVLAVCSGDGKVSLWKENLKGLWECVSEMQQ
ncbi:hypothetical protein CROQUDRAFT_663479 [Cronartium quercuum f. sp. fusiforme G11]|uniref:Sec13-like protein n=1 Tax=Cronartium quercuum f. sp. fusiforme G11 TaxID=708437 RepID=A0A9P6T8P4_9BASI|nr:hypothetical protein CROQUDRAFT_663479 [Cronartium quercuum f. sp. fusiforme G11]